MDIKRNFMTDDVLCEEVMNDDYSDDPYLDVALKSDCDATCKDY